MNNKGKYYILNFSVAFLAIYGIVMFLPILPILQEHFGATVSQISWLPNIGYLNMIIFSPIIGKLANNIKLNKLLIWAVFIWIIGLLIELIAIKSINFNLFIAGRFIEGIGEASFFPLLLTINKEVLKKENQNKVGASIMEIGSAIGGLMAGIFAGIMSKSLNTFLIIPIVIAVVVIIFVKIAIEDIKKTIENKNNIVREENNKVFVSLLLLIFLAQAVFVSAQVYLSYYLDIFDKASKTGLIISLEQIAIAFGALAPVILLKKFKIEDIRNCIILSLVIAVIGLSFNISYIVSVGLLLVISFLTGISFATLNISVAKVVKNNVSQKMSIYTSVRFLGGFIGSYILGDIIGNYIARGESLNQLFSKVYLSIGLLICIISAIAFLLQRNKKDNKEFGGVIYENVH